MKNTILYSILILLLFSCKPTAPTVKQTASYVTMGKSNVYYETFGKGTKDLVFIHGWGCDRKAWNKQVDFFADQARVVLIDLPGFGKSSKEKEAYHADFFAASVKAVLDELEIKAPILVGHSLGHPIARQLIKNYPNINAKLCIVDGVYFNFPIDSLARAAYDNDLYGFVDLFTGENQATNTAAFIQSLFVSNTPEEVKAYTDTTMTKVPHHVGHNTMQHLIQEKYWTKTPLAIPTLAVYANIPELPADNEQVLKAWYPDLTYHELDSVGHFLMMESPQAFNQLLSDWIKN